MRETPETPRQQVQFDPVTVTADLELASLNDEELFAGGTSAFAANDFAKAARYFGRLHIGSIRGATMIGTVGGTALGTYVLGLGYDLAGDYDSALYALLALPVLITIASFIVKRPPVRRAPSGATTP